MELLDLPPELFQHIVYLLVEDIGPVKSFAASFACKIFSSAIHENIFKLQPLGNLLQDRGEAAIYFFRRHGGQMLYNRMSRNESDDVSLFIRMMVDALIERYGSAQDDVRERFTRNLCHAVSANEWPELLFEDMVKTDNNIERFRSEVIQALPAAVAAIGELDILRNLVTCEQDLLGQHTSQILPSAFHVAVGVGNIEAVRWIMSLLTAPDNGYEASDPNATYNDDLKRISRVTRECRGRNLDDALVVAAYMSQQKAGIMLFDRACLLTDFCYYLRFDNCSNGSTNTLIDTTVMNPG